LTCPLNNRALQAEQMPHTHRHPRTPEGGGTVQGSAGPSTIDGMTDPAPKPAVGWYPDEKGPPVYWDGQHWDFKAKPPPDEALPGITPAGWYPEGINGQQYWNGHVWTGQRAPSRRHGNAPAILSVVFGGIAAGITLLYLAGIIGLFPAFLFGIAGLVLGIVGAVLSGRRRAGARASIVGTILSVSPVALTWVVGFFVE
jgi:hypothetical protein